MKLNADYESIRVQILRFKNLQHLSIDYEHLTNELLKEICSKNLKKYFLVFFNFEPIECFFNYYLINKVNHQCKRDRRRSYKQRCLARDERA